MKEIKKYIVMTDTKSPAIFATGQGRHPHKVSLRIFKKDEVVKGSIHRVKGAPVALMVEDIWVLPIKNVKLITIQGLNEENSAAEGQTKPSTVKIVEKVQKATGKYKYMDLAIAGALLGLGVTYMAGKKGWVNFEDKNTKLYGLGIGAAVGLYAAYRFLSVPPTKKPE